MPSLHPCRRRGNRSSHPAGAAGLKGQDQGRWRSPGGGANMPRRGTGRSARVGGGVAGLCTPAERCAWRASGGAGPLTRPAVSHATDRPRAGSGARTASSRAEAAGRANKELASASVTSGTGLGLAGHGVLADRPAAARETNFSPERGSVPAIVRHPAPAMDCPTTAAFCLPTAARTVIASAARVSTSSPCSGGLEGRHPRRVLPRPWKNAVT
jgi:hypothetical protein